MSVIPAAFTFRFSLPVKKVEAIPKSGATLLGLGDECELHWPTANLEKNLTAPISMRAGWNAMGIGLQFQVSGKSFPPVSNPDRANDTDGIQVWIGTRNTQTIHRANGYCHQFCLLPNGAGDDGQLPIVRQIPVSRAIEDAPIHDPESFQIRSNLNDDGYQLEVWFDSAQLRGFDPDMSRQMGFYVNLTDSELGNRPLTVGEDFPFATDPSIWQFIELQD